MKSSRSAHCHRMGHNSEMRFQEQTNISKNCKCLGNKPAKNRPNDKLERSYPSALQVSVVKKGEPSLIIERNAAGNIISKPLKTDEVLPTPLFFESNTKNYRKHTENGKNRKSQKYQFKKS